MSEYSLRIVSLATRMDLAETLARWHSEAFGAWLGGWDWRDALDELQTHSNPDAAPCSWVALADGAPVGSISLLLDDPPAPSDYGPWLASFYVAPAWRKQGVGGLLHEHCLNEAFVLGFPHLRLWTIHSTVYYQARGWRRIGAFPAHGATCILMEHTLHPV